MSIGDINSGIELGGKIKKTIIKPHLQANNDLLKYSKEITVSKGEDDNSILLNPEKFNLNLWSIEIKNKYSIISKTEKNVQASLYIHDIQKNIQLLWKPIQILPRIYFPAANITENHREEYKKRLPRDYCETFLQSNNLTKFTDIPKGSAREILLLFITEEFENKAFLITPSTDSNQWKDSLFFECINDIPLILPIPSKSRIDLLLQSINSYEYRFELDIISYDSIKLKPLSIVN